MAPKATSSNLVRVRDAQCPMGHMGTGWDTAHACLFLASDEASYVTAHDLVVDGGLIGEVRVSRTGGRAVASAASGPIILVPDWSRFGAVAMPVNLSIKNAPDDVVKRLKERAERHHRSLQGELMAILEEAAGASRRLTPDEVLAKVRELGLSTPCEAAAMIREDRDGR